MLKTKKIIRHVTFKFISVYFSSVYVVYGPSYEVLLGGGAEKF